MARINNSDTIKRILKDAQININVDDVPQQLASKVVPVLISNPERVSTFVYEKSFATSGGDAIFTTSATDETYITNLVLSIVKDAACDVSTQSINIDGFVNGKQRDLLSISLLTLTAQSETVSISFPYPLKLDKNKSLTLGGGCTFAAGVLAKTCNVIGFTVTPQNA